MRIGILTYCYSQENYGQILQCFASQKFFQLRGDNAYYIDTVPYQSDTDLEVRRSNALFSKLISASHWVYFITHVIDKFVYLIINKYFQNHSVNRHFDDFCRKYIKKTPQKYTYRDLLNSPLDFDALMVGSDMVWGSLGRNPIFFLNYGGDSIRRYSIAASFGKTFKDLGEEDKCRLIPLLSRFNGITIREEAGVDICHNLGLNKAKLVCDPTMLLERQIYDEIADTASVPDMSNRIFVYFLGSDASMISSKKIVSFISQKKEDYLFTSSSGCINTIPKYFATIEQWLASIRSAKFVITNSFHGVIFCLLFNKQFAVVPLKIENRNTRIETLLRKMNLEERICRTTKELASLFETQINYSVIDRKIESFRNISIKTIIEMMEG